MPESRSIQAGLEACKKRNRFVAQLVQRLISFMIWFCSFPQVLHLPIFPLLPSFGTFGVTEGARSDFRNCATE
jgi:hypothetical protein